MAAPGPTVLGRGVIVGPGRPVPPAWAAAERVLVDPGVLADPLPTVRRLHAAWASREPIAVELGVDPASFREPQVCRVEPWTLGAAFELGADRLHFLVWANNYDARGEAGPVWWWGRKAARLGARPAPDGHGDVLLADGTPVWVDGGPRCPLEPAGLGGLAVVHRESVELGRLTVAPPPRPPTAALAADQLAAVAHRSGPARVIAPAGSGKTRVLTERLRHLILDRGWERETVLAVAYNKKAQQELEARCADFRPRALTLNALGYLLLTERAGRPPRVLEEPDVRRLLDRLAPVRRRRANADPIAAYIEGLGAIRLGLADPEEVEAWRDDVPGLAGIFPRYRAALAELGAVDFDEQVYAATELLLVDGDFRRRAQAAHRHLLVDEFQDLTPAHVLLLRLLAGPPLDVFGVGDDDQVIYGHAGADPGFLLEFDRLFPGGGAHALEVNYRCPPGVVTAAGHLLSYNDRRVPKVIRCGRPSTGTGAVDLLVRTHQPAGGAAAVVEQVSHWLGDPGADAREIAVLCRVNALLLAPHVALAEAGVPLDSALRPEVLNRTGLKAALAYLRIATASDDGIAATDVIEVLRRPSRGLPTWFADRLRRRRAWSIDALDALSATVGDRDGPKVSQLVADLAQVRRAAGRGPATTASVLRVIKESVGLAGAMSLLDTSRGGEGSSHLDDLEALEQVAALHPDPATFEPWLRRVFHREGATGGVTLSTVHRVKGMEWDRVVIFGANAGIMPHRLADDPEEERRVLHVAITRGRCEVVVLADAGRPSPMLAELDGGAARAAPAGVAGGGALPTASGESVRARRPSGGRGDAVAGAPAGAGAEAGGRLQRSGLPGRKTGAAGRADEEPLEGVSAIIETSLREWRLERCRRDKVSAFIVLYDRTLRAIARAKPTTLAQLRHIEGIGPTKLDQYGEEILAVVARASEAEGGAVPGVDAPGAGR